MRLQKAVEVGHYVLKDNSIAIDTLTEKGCLKNQAPITVGAAEEIPVFVLYQTAWFDSEDKVRFYKDIYEKFSSKKNF
jgi:murein L,D-transpeptidase YcbB/YkuD